jgi:hypothetical protein
LFSLYAIGGEFVDMPTRRSLTELPGCKLLAESVLTQPTERTSKAARKGSFFIILTG